MSTWDGCYFAGDPNYTLIGPGLNAANMRNMGWLDETRVWKPSTAAFAQQIELRPLHARGLPGFLAIEVPGAPGGFLVEFRVAEDWDVGFPRAAVFVHRLDNGYSYRMKGTKGNSDLVEGDSFNAGVDIPSLSSYLTIHVDEINRSRHYAKVSVSYRPRDRHRIPDLVGEVFGGVAVDGGGILWVNGRPHPVDPWGPLREVVLQIVAYTSADQIANPLVRLDAKRSALSTAIQVASKELEELNELHTPAAQTRKATVMRQGQRSATRSAAGRAKKKAKRPRR
jgi:hypothetical protein